MSTRCKGVQRDSCSAQWAQFSGAKAGCVSTGYECRELPRVLFVSLDPGWSHGDARNRLPSSVREDNEAKCFLSDIRHYRASAHYSPRYKTQHWYRTHELAWHILRRFSVSLDIKDTCKHFAHANSAKCCWNMPHKKQAPAVLFANCAKYLGGELKILQPDIVVTQGAPAARLLEDRTRERLPQGHDGQASLVTLEGRRLFWLRTPHQTRFGEFCAQSTSRSRSR